ncbi:hypothetical protein BC943DRAFT_188928 [Umbelopsis sp. AD052]|nr:hypothetical protein BC943DRAFT_188928 [Umbelopsis sp. AD052]
MQSTTTNHFKAQEAEKPTSLHSSSDFSPCQSPPSRSSADQASKIPYQDNTRRSFVEEEDEEIVIPSTAVRKHLDHSQPKISAYRRSSMSLPSTLSKAQSMDVVRQRDQYAIQDHYSIKPFDQPPQQNSTATPRKRRVSGESTKSIQSNYSNASIFGSGASINRFPQIMKSSFGSVKQFVSRSASISTSSRSRFSLRPGDSSSSSGSSGSVLQSVQEKHSPQPSFNSISTPTQRGSKISRFRHRTSSIIDLSTIFTKPNSPMNGVASHSSIDVSPTHHDRRVAPRITITNQQQNDTQKVQDPRHLPSLHRLPHPLETHRIMSTHIDEYQGFTDKPGGVGTILFGKEIADINMEDISSDVNPAKQDDGVKDASQVQ